MFDFLAMFCLGMAVMLLFKAPFDYFRELWGVDAELLEKKAELKIKELQVLRLEKRIRELLDLDELEQLKLELYERYGVDWYSTNRYKTFKERRSFIQ